MTVSSGLANKDPNNLGSASANLQDSYRVEHQKSLKVLTKLWSRYHKGEDAVLREMVSACKTLSNHSRTLNLTSLTSIYTNMALACESTLKKTKARSELVQEVDWLFGQLIKGNAEEEDPFLLCRRSSDTNGDNAVKDNNHTRMFLGKPHIVIIDDQASVGQSLSMSLQDFSLNVSYFDSVNAFKEVMDDIEVDLVLLDIVMPNITQEEVFVFAAELVQKGIKVISCSAKFTFETRLLAVRANVSDYAVKPINTYVLVEKIGRVLGLQHQRKFNVVILDDQVTMGEFYQTMLEQAGYDVSYFNDAEKLFAALDDLKPDMFLLDQMMPNVSGIEVTKMLRHEHKFDFAPILFLTADEQLDTKLAALEAGADDVIVKSTPVQTITQMIDTRLTFASEVRAFVAKDQLTGVLNHGQIVESANQTIRLAHRRNSQASIAVIDVDHFKQVNDTHGHLVGDKVLCALGQLLASSVRETDFVGRYGGEEFVIVFVDCSLQDAAHKTQIIKENFANMVFSSPSSKFSVTFSAGVISLSQFDNIQPAIAIADKALYKAKEGGRNKVVKYAKK